MFASGLATFFTRAYDQLRMAAISDSNINLCGAHCGLSVGKKSFFYFKATVYFLTDRCTLQSKFFLLSPAHFQHLPLSSLTLCSCDSVTLTVMFWNRFVSDSPLLFPEAVFLMCVLFSWSSGGGATLSTTPSPSLPPLVYLGGCLRVTRHPLR